MVTFEAAKCPLRDCGADLHLTTMRSGLVYADGTADDGITSSWSIGCEAGHVVLVPEDTAEDYYAYEESDVRRLLAMTGALDDHS